MPKLDAKHARRSKLNTERKDAAKPLGVVTQKRASLTPTSVRLTPEEKQKLAEMMRILTPHSTRKVSEASVMRALIHLGSEYDEASLVEAYRRIL